MQRKSLDSNKSPANATKSKHQEVSSTQEPITNTSHQNKKRDINTQSLNNTRIILEIATAVDIHGPTADIIGRRSFNGYHKSISNTWDASYAKRTESASRKNRQEKISDEELLRRYERYVKVGREKSGLGDEKKRKRKAV